MYWQLLDNEKHVQCSEPHSTTNKENNSTTSLTRTTSKFTSDDNLETNSIFENIFSFN